MSEFSEHTSSELNINQNNVILGNRSAKNTKVGVNNVFIGSESGEYSVGTIGSTFIGNRAGRYSKVGKNNIFIGNRTGINAQHSDCILIGDVEETKANQYMSIANVIQGFNIYGGDDLLQRTTVHISGDVSIEGIVTASALQADSNTGAFEQVKKTIQVSIGEQVKQGGPIIRSY